MTLQSLSPKERMTLNPIFFHRTCSNILKTYLVEKQKANPKFSLRAFAKRVKVSPGQLSQILSNKKIIASEKALEVADLLHFSEDEKELFHQLSILEATKDENARYYIQERVQARYPQNPFELLNYDTFKVVSEWYHFAIIEMLELKDFKPDISWIANKLKLEPLQVELALDRLERLKFIKRTKKKWKKLKTHYLAETKVPTSAHTQYHRQTLNHALNHLEQQDASARYFSSVVFPMDKSKISKAKEKIDAFRLEMEKLLSKGTSKTHIYQLALQLFNITE